MTDRQQDQLHEISPSEIKEQETRDQDFLNQECAEFQAKMADMIGAGEDLQSDPHMLTCERCRSLVSELETIAEAARLLFPKEEEPEKDLWINIQMAIEQGEA
jgi:uncharacterized protein (UPF0147 family)